MYSGWRLKPHTEQKEREGGGRGEVFQLSYLCLVKGNVGWYEHDGCGVYSSQPAQGTDCKSIPEPPRACIQPYEKQIIIAGMLYKF